MVKELEHESEDFHADDVKTGEKLLSEHSLAH
jgi:hypothetical protein